MAPGAGGIRASSPDLPPARQRLANSARRPRVYSAVSALPRLPRRPSIRGGAAVVACARGSEQQSSPAVAAKARPEPDTLSVEFQTRDGCRLVRKTESAVPAVSAATAPKLIAHAHDLLDPGGPRPLGAAEVLPLLADVEATTRFLGLPLPPFLKIDILPEALGGTIDRATGQVTVRLLRSCLLCIHARVVFTYYYVSYYITH